MNAQQVRLLQRVMTAALAFGVLGMVAWALSPIPKPAAVKARGTSNETQKTASPPGIPEEEDFGLLLYKPLQQQLIATPQHFSNEPHLVRKVAIPSNLKLLATLVENDRSSALLTTADGELKWCRVGERLGNETTIEVLEIEPATVVIRYLGQSSTLQLAPGGDG